jgi:DNA-binding transcriptional regulator GbsR (MarR family)
LSPEAAAFVERMAADLVEAGTQRMAARVFACLMISEEPGLTSAQLAHHLQVSPAAISGAVRYLALARMIRRERQPGSRRELYRLHSNFWHEAMTRRDEFLGRWLQTMKDGMQVVSPGSAAHQRLEETAEFLGYMDEEIAALLERWHERQRQSGKEDAESDPGSGSGSDGDGET